MEHIALETFIGLITTALGAFVFVRTKVSRMEQQITELERRITEHRENNDAHVTRTLIQDLDSRLGGPTDREWGEHVNEVKEIRHDLRNLMTAFRLTRED